MWWLLAPLLYFFGTTVAENEFQQNYYENKTYDNIDRIIYNLQKQVWNENETICLKQTLFFLNGVKNKTLWATWIWDSNPHPVSTFYGSQYHLGGYDQCLKTPWSENQELKTQYCLADLKLSSVTKNADFDPYSSIEDYFQSKMSLNRELSSISYGVCLPLTCNSGSAVKILEAMFETTHLGPLHPEVKINSCQIGDQEFSTEFCVFMIIVILLISFVVTSTWLVEDKSSDNIVSKISNTFCMKRNLKDLFKVYDSEIPIINVLKTIFAICSACMHHFLFGMGVAPMNVLDFDKLLSHPLGSIVFHADVGVETFYTISGLFLVKNLYGKSKNPIKLILIRYFRLVVPFAFMIFYTAAVSQSVGSGPIWDKTAGKEAEYCRKNWLLGALMLNNYVRDKEICQITWYYIPSDFHMAAIGTTIIYLYKKEFIGNKILGLFSVFIMAIPGYVTYVNKYQAIPFYDSKSLLDPRSTPEYLDAYMKTHNRMGSYIIGMIMGYILSIYKPTAYRNIISTKWTSLGTLSLVAALFAIISSGAMMLSREYSPIEAGLYAATNRVLWAVVVCGIIGLAEYGDLPFLNFLRGFSAFVPISRLSYSIYLTHTSLLQRRWYSSRSPYAFDVLSMLMDGAGMVSFTVAVSLVLWLLVEAPLGHITTLILDPKPKAKIAPEKLPETKKIEEVPTPTEEPHVEEIRTPDSTTDRVIQNGVRFRITRFGS